MSFTAELQNISVYPKSGKYLCFALVKQDSNLCKIVYKCTADEVMVMITHEGPIRFHGKNPQVTTHKQQQIMMYEVDSIVAVSTENTNQPTITTMIQNEIKFD